VSEDGDGDEGEGGDGEEGGPPGDAHQSADEAEAQLMTGMTPALTADFFWQLTHTPTEAYTAIIIGHRVTVRFNANTNARVWCIYPPGLMLTLPIAPGRPFVGSWLTDPPPDFFRLSRWASMEHVIRTLSRLHDHFP